MSVITARLADFYTHFETSNNLTKLSYFELIH